MAGTAPIPEDRPLTAQGAALVRWLLEHGGPDEGGFSRSLPTRGWCPGARAAAPASTSPSTEESRQPEWTIELANGVTEACVVRADGTASVLEERRKADGEAEMKGGAVVIAYKDDRVERWTPVGRRVVVGHWCPSAASPAGPAVLGIGRRTR